jgi:WD40 repeat protein
MIAPALAQDPDDPDMPEDENPLRPLLALETGGHTARVMNMGFTPDGKELVTVSRDRTIRFWHVGTGELRRVLRVYAYHFPPGGTQTTIFTDDGKTLVLNLRRIPEEGKKRELLFVNLVDIGKDRVLELDEKPGNNIYCMAMSRDKKWLATIQPDGAVIYDARTGKRLHHFDAKGQGNRLAFSSDSKRLAVQKGPRVHILDVATGKRAALLNLAGLEGLDVHALTWSHDDGELFIGTKDGVEEWDVKMARKNRAFGVGKTVSFMWEQEKEKNVLFTSGALPGAKGPRASVLQLRMGREREPFPVSEWAAAGDAFDVVAVSHDGKKVAAVGFDQMIHIWGRVGGELKRTMQGQGLPFHAAGWSKDGKSIAWGLTLNRKTSGIDDKKPLERAFNLSELSFVPRPDPDREPDEQKKYLQWLADCQRRVLDRGDGVLLRPKAPPTIVRDGKTMNLGAQVKRSDCGTLLPGNRALLGMLGGVMDLMDTVTGKLIVRLSAHSDAVTDIAPSPDRDNRYVLTASRAQTLKIWDTSRLTTDRKPLLTMFVAGEDWIVWTKQGYYAASPGGEKLMGWSVPRPNSRYNDFLSADRFRKVLYRPDVIRLVLEKGSVEEALKAANAAAQIKNRAPVEVDDLVPPKVSLELVGKTGAKIHIKITYEGTPTQPVESLQLRLNGRSFPDPEGKYALKVETGKGPKTIEKEVELPPGKHELKVMVRGPDTSDVSEPLIVRTPLPPNMQPMLHIVSAGINDYQIPQMNLKAAIKDAEDVHAALRKHCVGPTNLFGTATGEPLKNPKRDDVLKALRDVRAKHKAKPGDLMVFFFAGHGYRDNKSGEFYLLTQEADTKDLAKTAISGKELHGIMKDMPCQVLLIFDACQSAAGLAAFRPTDELSRKMTDEEAAVTVLVAAMAHEYSEEVGGNGRLTRALKSALEARPGVGYDPYEQVMYIQHIYTYVYAEVRKGSKGKQNPALLTPWTVPPLVVRNAPQAGAGEP